MTGRMKIVDGWRTHLAENQRLAAKAPPYRRWMHRICVRVYRFLISRYGAGEWQAGAESAPGEQRTSMELVDRTEGIQGSRPKSADRIRAALDAVHDARDNPPSPGRRGHGLEFSDWVAVASRSSLVSPRRLVRLLRSHGLGARQVRRGDDVIVEVFAGQREEAMELLECHRPGLRISHRRADRHEATELILREAVEHSVVYHAGLGIFWGAVVGLVPMLLLMGILDAVFSPRSWSAGGTTASVVFFIGWGVFALGGAIVAVARYYKTRD